MCINIGQQYGRQNQNIRRGFTEEETTGTNLFTVRVKQVTQGTYLHSWRQSKCTGQILRNLLQKRNFRGPFQNQLFCNSVKMYDPDIWKALGERWGFHFRSVALWLAQTVRFLISFFIFRYNETLFFLFRKKKPTKQQHVIPSKREPEKHDSSAHLAVRCLNNSLKRILGYISYLKIQKMQIFYYYYYFAFNQV